MSRRNLPRLDYKVLHNTGERVIVTEEDFDQLSEKLRSLSTMSNFDTLQENEKKILTDKEEFKLLNSENGLSDPDYISEYREILVDFYKKFKTTHEEMIKEIGSTEHARHYPKYDELLEEFKVDIKEVDTEKRRMRDEERALRLKENALRLQEIEDRKLEREERRLEREERRRKEEKEDQIRKEEKIQSEDRRKQEELATQERILKEEKENEAKLQKEKEDELAIAEKEQKEKDENEKLRKDLFEKECLAAKSLINEISLIEQSLKGTYEVDVSLLADELLLENKKNIINYDQLRFKLVEKITRLNGSIPIGYENRVQVVDEHCKIPDKISKLHETFVKNITKECLSRNISETNLREASAVSIELEKFSGYNSEIDIYTFQIEFEKLHLSRIRKSLLPDYLKHNYLEGSALTVVKGLNDLESIWDRLKEAFGDTKVLLHNKLKEVSKFGQIWRIRDKEKLMQVLAKLVYAMIELQDLAEKHKIENNLYYGGTIEAIYKVIGYKDRDKFVLQHVGTKISEKSRWRKLIEFLQLKLKGEEELYLIEKSSYIDEKDEKKEGRDKVKKTYHADSEALSKKCYLCGDSSHQVIRDYRGKYVIPYFCCKKFVDLTPAERFKLLREKGLCHQCLAPGAPLDASKHKIDCYSKFCCKHKSHEKHTKKKHVLVCEEHKEFDQNRDLLEEYKNSCILGLKEKDKLPEFSKKISFHSKLGIHHSDMSTVGNADDDDDDTSESAIYILQTIQIENEKFNLFFDGGCGDLVSKWDAIDRLHKLGKASLKKKGPIHLFGVGNLSSVSPHGIYKVTIPLCDRIGRKGENKKNAIMSGVCLDQVTAKFPMYPLKGVVENDIRKFCKSKKLPSLPKEVGGDTDLMIGIKYLKYFPKEIFQLDSGLTIYESKFMNPDGSRGVVGGPHELFSKIESKWFESNVNFKSFCNQQLKLFKMGYKVSLDMPLLTMKETEYITDDKRSFNTFSKSSTTYPVQKRSTAIFDAIEKAGTEVPYRCVDCRNCSNCKKSDQTEHVTIQEEVEQALINKSVKVDIDAWETRSRLPFLADPAIRLEPNDAEVRKIYNGVIKGLSKQPSDRRDVIEFDHKLQDLGFVDWFDNLTNEQQQIILSSKVRYLLPWRPVWNRNSNSTKCRMVFDASHCTKSGYSLNSILPKGRNNMNKLVDIIMRWLIYAYAYTTDIKTMYNRVKLEEEDWCYQLYYFDPELSLERDPRIKVIKTLIYGVRSSGNQAERAVRETARMLRTEYPRASEVAQKDLYVDDCMSGEQTEHAMFSTTDELDLLLRHGGFSLKAFTFSGYDPPESMASEDGVSVKVAGFNWYPKVDEISLNTKNLNFSRKKRGKKNAEKDNQIPSEFNRRQCVGKVHEIFDLLGKAAPIIAGFKLDLRELVNRRLDWDDKIPNELKALWISNFQMIQDLSNIRWKRAVIPVDAESLDIDTIDTGDASKGLACVAIYARFKRKNGDHSCQLLFARTKLVPEGMTQPRAELFASYLNATAGHVVKIALGSLHKKQIKLTDSQVALHWISNANGVLKPWVRNSVIEINRLAESSLWRYVESKNMIADIGTRKGASLEDIGSESTWINGFDWMRKDESQFPVLTVDEVKLDPGKLKDLKVECLKGNSTDIIWSDIVEEDTKAESNYSKYSLDELEKRYKFSNYVIDPNKFRFKKVVRVLALMLLFLNNIKRKIKVRLKRTDNSNEICNREIKSESLSAQFITGKYLVTTGKIYKISRSVTIQCKPGLVITLSKSEINDALWYFFRKATLEIKEFLSNSVYRRISEEINGILYYKGRILPSQKVGGRKTLSDVMLDLSRDTFHVPLTDSFSPIAYSVVSEVHWYDESAMHLGAETVLRYTQKITHIIEGRELVKKFKKSCQRCRYLEKRPVQVSMGPVNECNMMIAPAFFATQVDLCGPFLSYSSHNKRATVSIWFVVFCCCTTGAISIKVMDDYSTSAFLSAFIRFSSVYGYPKLMLPDEGSQLVKGCKSMQLVFTDIQHQLNFEFGIEFRTCPVGGHNMHGKVERKIRQVRESIRKKLHGERLSILEWETLGDQIANNVNNLPIATVNVSADLEHLDILTPNRLLLGRNNDRSPSGPMLVTKDCQKILQSNIDIFTAWFECWLISYVPKLMEQPKWFNSDQDMKIGDIVLFLRTDKEFSRQYQYGIVQSVERGKDEKIRTVTVRYRNPSEQKDRETRRAVRDLVVIHHVDEISTFEEISLASRSAMLAYIDF